MNSPDLEYEQTLASPSDRSQHIEFHIAQQLQFLQDQITNVNNKLQTNLKILKEKQSENSHLKDLLCKLEYTITNISPTQSTEPVLSSESVCISCKACNIF